MDPLSLLFTKLRKLLRSRGRTTDDADDLIQEAFLRLQVYCQGKSVEQPEGFLVRAALNLSIDDLRSARRRHGSTTTLDALQLVDTRPLPEEALATEQRLQRAKQALDALSPRAREVFLLHRAEGYSYGQIAQRLGIGLSTVEKHMAKAALFFDAWLDKEDAE
jgi:RNA polymerase sigma factor (sigma-70 family)